MHLDLNAHKLEIYLVSHILNIHAQSTLPTISMAQTLPFAGTLRDMSVLQVTLGCMVAVSHTSTMNPPYAVQPQLRFIPPVES